jgi:MFS family permease
MGDIFIFFLIRLQVMAPLLLAYLVGMVLALAFWRRCPRPSRLTLLGLGLRLVTALVGTFLALYLLQAGKDLSTTQLIENVIAAAAFGLLLAAVFIGRKPALQADESRPVQDGKSDPSSDGPRLVAPRRRTALALLLVAAVAAIALGLYWKETAPDRPARVQARGTWGEWFVETLALMSPGFVVDLVGVILALVRWRRHPRVSLLTLLAIGLFVSVAVGGSFLFAWLPDHLKQRGWKFEEIMVLYPVMALIRNALFAVGYALLLVAIFAGRSSKDRLQKPSTGAGDPASPIPMEQEFRAVVGSNSDYYLEDWQPALSGQSRASGFNVAAFFLFGLWLGYRKMYKAVFILFGIILAATVMEYVLFLGILKMQPLFFVMSALVWLVGALVVAIVAAVCSNGWYLSHVQRVIAEVRSQGLEEDAHLKALAARGGTSLGASLGLFSLFVVTIFAVSFVLTAVFGDRRLQVTADEEIYYSRDITEAEARTLARVLQRQAFFNGAGKKSVRLRKDGQDYALSVVLLFGFDDPQVHQHFRALARQVSRAFGGKAIRVELCNMWMIPKKKLPAEREP